MWRARQAGASPSIQKKPFITQLLLLVYKTFFSTVLCDFTSVSFEENCIPQSLLSSHYTNWIYFDTEHGTSLKSENKGGLYTVMFFGQLSQKKVEPQTIFVI